jgi:hypothetical protein
MEAERGREGYWDKQDDQTRGSCAHIPAVVEQLRVGLYLVEKVSRNSLWAGTTPSLVSPHNKCGVLMYTIEIRELVRSHTRNLQRFRAKALCTSRYSLSWCSGGRSGMGRGASEVAVYHGAVVDVREWGVVQAKLQLRFGWT